MHMDPVEEQIGIMVQKIMILKHLITVSIASSKAMENNSAR